MFQVVVAVVGCAVAVLMVGFLSFPLLRCVKTIIVATNIIPKKSTHLAPGFVEQFGECSKPAPPQVAQLLAMSCLHRFIQAAQELEPGRRDPGRHHTPVLGFPRARDQPSLFQAVKKASDVRISRDHPIRNLPAGEPSGGAAQDAQHVVLRHGKILRFENRDQTSGQHIRRPQHVQESSLLGVG